MLLPESVPHLRRGCRVGRRETVTMTPVERLEAAGLCKSAVFSEKEREALNSLSEEEVDQLINLHRKLGTPDSNEARANFPV